MSEVIRADIYDVISDKNIPWHELRDSTVLVTGATGLIGGALVRALASANAEHNSTFAHAKKCSHLEKSITSESQKTLLRIRYPLE